MSGRQMGDDIQDSGRTTISAGKTAANAVSSGSKAGAGNGAAAGAASAAGTDAGAAVSAGESAAGAGAAGAGAAAETAAGGAAAEGAGAVALPIIIIILACIAAFFFIFGLFGAGVDSTSMNSTSQVEASQDYLTEAEKETAKTDFTNSYKTEKEGINIMAKALGSEENEAYENLEEICKNNGLGSKGYEATLQFLETSGFIEYGEKIVDFDEQGTGAWTEDEIDAATMLAAYSISMDNLWGKECEEIYDVDVSNIDTSTKEGRALYIYVKMRNAGYPHNAACGMLGNLEQETGSFNPEAVNSIGAAGLAQWYMGRLTSLKTFAKGKGKKWNDLNAQVDFILYELNNGYSKTVKTPIKKSNISLKRATYVILTKYEAAGNYTVEMSARYAYAKKWDEKFKDVDLKDYVIGGSGTSCAQGAVQWALKIAADDSFAYGKSPAANHFGCYFCGNQKTKQKHAKRLGINRSYAKTYCCNPFVTAAYVHGGKVKGLKCTASKGINLKQVVVKQFKQKKKSKKYLYENFALLGHIKKSDLQPGDILLTNTHAKMYIGNNKQVEATGGKRKGCWGPDSISTRKLKYPSGCVVLRCTAGNTTVSQTGINGALAWAKKIANDNSYTYGGSTCYTCKGGAKQYVCTTFVRAAYAHGAKDADMLKNCKSSKYGMVSDLKNYMKKSNNWKYLGKISQSKMKAGDVVFWSNSHTEIYYGNGKRVGAHGRSNRAAKDQISIENMYGGYTDVFRYIGAGSSGSASDTESGSVTTYSKYTVINKIKKSDCKKAAKIKGVGSSTCPQSMAYLGNDVFVIAYSNTTGGDTVQYLKKYTGSKAVKTKKASLGHANGLCYNSKTGTLYSVRGYGCSYAQTYDKKLNYKGKKKLGNGTSGIAYDSSNNSYYLSSGNTIRVKNASFSLKKTIKKKGAWRYAQDVGGSGGIVYSCVCTNKSGKNRINMYEASSGKYCGSYQLNWSGCEIEDAEVDEEGHLLILINHRGSNTDYIYRTKEAMTLTATDSEGESSEYDFSMYSDDNWRKDMPNKIETYLSDPDHEPLYKIVVKTDEDGNVETGTEVIDTGKGETDEVEEEKDKNEEDLYDDENDTSNLAESVANKLKNTISKIFKRKATLKKVEYVKASIQKADITAFAFNCFGVTNEKIEELYGPEATGEDVALEMGQNTIALLHNVADFSADNLVEPLYEDSTEELPYEIGDSIGKWKITTYCGCSAQSCKTKRMSLFGSATLKSGVKRSAGVTAATGNPSTLPVGSVIYNKKIGIIVITEELAARSNTIAIYTGNNHKTSQSLTKEINKYTQGNAVNFFATSGMTKNEAISYGNNLGYGNTSSTQKRIAAEAKKRNTYGSRAGYCEQWAYLVYKKVGLSNAQGFCCAARGRDTLAKTCSGTPPLGATVYSKKGYYYSSKTCSCGRNCGHVGIFVGNVNGTPSVASNVGGISIISWKQWCKQFGNGGYSFRGVKVN